MKPVPRGLVAPLPLTPRPPPRPRPRPCPWPDEVLRVSLVSALTVVSPAVLLLQLMSDELKVLWRSPSLCSVVDHYTMYLVHHDPRHGSSQPFLVFAPRWSGRRWFVNSIFNANAVASRECELFRCLIDVNVLYSVALGCVPRSVCLSQLSNDCGLLYS